VSANKTRFRSQLSKAIKDSELFSDSKEESPSCCGDLKTNPFRHRSASSHLSSEDLMYATEHVEFFYKDTDAAVKEGDPIGFDMDMGEGVELILFDNIYWDPQY
jgi:hypothetical protein|tara:strand:- start:649 stop:960 length:312 start_codon:yes stop_codon:yes gene_type:complete